ncbi:MAG: HD domain-containing protein [Nanoarchaeota archaeon]|nr:HD domain-containing protein [Nanoarchaeota archaeon]
MKKRISEIKIGEIINNFFVVKIKKGIQPYANGFSFTLLLSDETGKTVNYKYWGGTSEEKIKLIYDSIKPDSIVHVQGKAGEYNNKTQITTNEPYTIKVVHNGLEFIKPAKKDLEKMWNELLNTISKVENPEIKKLLQKTFLNQEFAEKFKKHPGAIEIHHNWIGGLLQHTLEVLNYCKMAWHQHPELNKDLLIAGALLHDIGKLEELEVTSRIKGSKKGQLISHLVLSAIKVNEEMRELNDDLKNKILHMIVSHHGKPEYGSPKPPMFPEALVVYYADEMSSKTSEMIEFIKDAKQDTEDDFMYSRRHNKNVLLK